MARRHQGGPRSFTQATRTELQGVPELKAALEELGAEVATKIGVSANRKAAVMMRDKMKQAAPRSTGSTRKSWRRKDGSVQTADYGHLQDNLRASRRKARKEGSIVHLVTVGKAWWGLLVEYGTIKMAARPWMRPTFDANVQGAIDVQVEELNKGIRRAARRIKGAKVKGA
ncbi:hypothetical protein BSL82_05685 [Tardibacter chloracetimidivorans]|uniref:HK97 gp10 family phage protein n=1 Tax=Tardibacter chloracetimidivorans TaxID=1921510 RepID=A0A1L3ZTA5_9SPHN|nr:HK97-gp10 family putative phage morphogenesis protein [Tardibacter chloracetimidivorans]API58864.1 hypothetical protein BSL82_05685 [Tardibacter chloracetimidivorans]